MSLKHSKQLVPFLKRRAGTNLRGVLYYDNEGSKIHYLREDIETSKLAKRYPSTMRRFRQESTQEEQSQFPFSNMEATVRIFEDAVVIHLIQGEQTGTVMTFEPDGTQVMRGFLRECIDRL